jgi:hypothetical protein
VGSTRVSTLQSGRADLVDSAQQTVMARRQQVEMSLQPIGTAEA